MALLSKAGLSNNQAVEEAKVNPEMEEETTTDGMDEDDADEMDGTAKRKKDPAKAAFYNNFKKMGVEQLKADIESKKVLGSSSNKVAFLYSLGNPASKGTRTEKGTSKISAINVVGYKFKALADIKVPVVNRDGLKKSDVMGINSVTWVDVKKGQEFDLSRAELGEMITMEEYNGIFSGDPNNVVGFYVSVSKLGNTFQALALLKKETEGSAPIKSNIVPVAKKKEGTEGKSVHDYEIIKGYEKYAYIFEEVKSEGRAPREGVKRAPGQSSAELAASFRAMRNKAQRQ